MTDLERAVLKQALAALDTAAGVCQLVEAKIEITDLPDCKGEIDAARVSAARVLGMLQ